MANLLSFLIVQNVRSGSLELGFIHMSLGPRGQE